MKTIVERFTALLACFIMIVIAGCSYKSNKPAIDIYSIKTYQDIPGVTEAEIADIEAVKKSRQSFSYGSTVRPEAYAPADGTYSGFTARFSELLSGLFGIPFVPETHEQDSLMEGFDNLSIDFISELMPTPECEQKYIMTVPITERMISGGSDVQPAGFVFTPYGIASGVNPLPLIYAPLSLATANRGLKPFIDLINKYIEAGGINKIHELYIQSEREYSQLMFYESLTPDEKAYIADLNARGAKVPVTKEADNFPLCFYDSNYNGFQGIAPDILNEISLLSGIEFETVTDKNTTMAEILEIVKTGGAAFDSELIRTSGRENDFTFPQMPYYSSHFALLSKVDYPYIRIYQASRARVGVVSGTAPAELYDYLIPFNRGYIEYQTRNEALDALENDEIDLFLTTDYLILYQTHYREKTGYKINFSFTTMTQESFFGFNKNEQILCSIMDKAQGKINTGKIIQDWSNRVYDTSKRAARERYNYMTMFSAILFSLLVILIILFIKNSNIQKLYKRQTSTLSAIYDALPDLVLCKDLNGSYTSCNSRFEDYAGYNESELIGKTVRELSKLADRASSHVSDIDAQVISEKITVRFNEWLTYSDGNRRYFETTKTPLIRDGRVIGLLGILRDRTESQVLMEKTQESYKRTRLMLDTIPICCFIMHKDTSIIDCNNEALRLFELQSKQEFSNRFFRDLSPEFQSDDRNSHEAAMIYIAQAFQDGHCIFEWTHQQPDGSPIPAIVTMSRVLFEDEQHLIIYIQDMREHTKMTGEIDKQNELLKAVNSVSLILLEPDMNYFEDNLLMSIGLMAKAVDVNRVCIRKNYIKNDKLLCTLAYEWRSSTEQQINDKLADDISYEMLPGWTETLSQGHCINSQVSSMSPLEREQLEPQGIRSLFVMPVFTKGTFWGYVSFDDHYKRRTFTENESMIMRSAGRMIANAFIRNDMTRNILVMTTQLETAVKEANEANRLKNISINSLESILNSIDAFIYVTVPETGELLFINKQMRKLFGIKDDEGIGTYCYELFRSDGCRTKCDYCPCYQLDENPDKIVIWDEYAALLERYIRHADCYIDWPNGEKVHLQHAVDITELITAREQAEQSSRSKSIFLSHMSHEIRTPMNAILGIAEIQLQKDMLPPEVEEAFGKIYESGDLLLNIINDILDLSKIEVGKLELVPVKYDIPSLINDTAQLIRLRYDSKPIEFTLQVDGNTPLELIGDCLRIKQVLNNILSNAFKYTDEGTVEFSVSSSTETFNLDGNVTLIFRVSDTGQGMTKNQLARLFDEYSRFNLMTNRTTVGTGLGMNITKRLVELMNGTITVESEPNKGSVFTVCLPQKRAGQAVCGPELTDKLQNIRFQSTAISKKSLFLREYMPYGSVLVVDDVESNIYVVKGMLLPYGLKIETASSGIEAIEKIRDGSVYDIVFMDHMMPKMDGIEAAKKLREMGYTHTIVALTANALVGQADVFLQNGFDGFISKPIDSRELNLLLNDFIRNKKAPEVVETARREQREKGLAPYMINTFEKEVFFVRDAENAIQVLENMTGNIHNLSDAETSLYITTVHGIKSALANIGEKELSSIAFKLEKAGEERNLTMLANDTSGFIKALRSLVVKIKPPEESGNIDISAEDEDYVRNKLEEIKTACTVFDKKTAKAALDDLRQRTWPRHITNVLDDIAVHILHSAFKKAAAIAENTIAENMK